MKYILSQLGWRFCRFAALFLLALFMFMFGYSFSDVAWTAFLNR